MGDNTLVDGIEWGQKTDKDSYGKDTSSGLLKKNKEEANLI